MRKLKNIGKELARRNSISRDGYDDLVNGVIGLVEASRVASFRTVNTILTSTYWVVGQRIVEHEQSGAIRQVTGKNCLRSLLPT